MSFHPNNKKVDELDLSLFRRSAPFRASPESVTWECLSGQESES